MLSYGDAATLSFHATKVFHTIEGGAIIFKDKAVYKKAKQLINFGLDISGFPTGLGTNAKLNEYQSAVGLTLLDKIDDILEHRQTLFLVYTRLLESHFQLPYWDEHVSFKNGSYFPIILENETEKMRIKSLLDKLEIPNSEYFYPSLNMVFNPQDICPISQSMASRILCLPLHYYMTVDEVEHISSMIKRGRA